MVEKVLIYLLNDFDKELIHNEKKEDNPLRKYHLDSFGLLQPYDTTFLLGTENYFLSLSGKQYIK